MTTLRDALQPVFPAVLWQNQHFVKRIEGILWNLWVDQPVFFLKQVANIPGIDQGFVSAANLRINQAGFPEIFLRIEAALLRSQYLSLVMASLAVFILVSITQLSLRRGLASLLSAPYAAPCVASGSVSWHVHRRYRHEHSVQGNCVGRGRDRSAARGL